MPTIPLQPNAHSNQHSRLLSAIATVVAEDGYAHATVGHIAERAQVSRATFYELFADKEACFLRAQRELAQRVRDTFGQAVEAAGDSAGATAAALSSLAQFAETEPSGFTLLTHEALLAGSRAGAERDRLLAALAGTLEHAWASAGQDTAAPDLPTEILLAAGIRVLGIQMRRGDHPPREALGELVGWTQAYDAPVRTQKWRHMKPKTALIGPKPTTAPRPIAPLRLPSGRHRLPVAVVRRVQRERILHASAAVIGAKGYARATVADVASTAGVSREVFYAHFRNKTDAFERTVELVFEHGIGTMARAFFACPGVFRERLYEGGGALLRLVAEQPDLIQPILSEAYAIDQAGRRTDDFLFAFTMFLREACDRQGNGVDVPYLARAAIASAVLEIVTNRIHRNRAKDLPGLLPLVAYIALAPIIGHSHANAFVQAKTTGGLREDRRAD